MKSPLARRQFPFNWQCLVALLALLAPALAPAETAIQAWVARYNGTGNNTDNAHAVAVNSSNCVIVSGSSYGGAASGFDYATIQYSSTGTPQWTNRFASSGSGSDSAVAVLVDSSNNVVVAGYSAVSSNFNFLTIKYSAAGAPLWTNRYAGPGGASAQAAAAAIGRNNNVAVTGVSGGNYHTVQYSSAGVPTWTNIYNGPANGADTPTAIAIDSSNNVIVTGRSAGGAIGTDFATVKYSSSGTRLWTNRFDGPTSSIDEGEALTTDSSNNVIVIGRAVTDLYSFGIVKYSSAGVPLWTNYFREPAGTTAYPKAVAVDRDNNVFVTGSWFAGLYENLATVSYSSAGAPRWTNYYDGPTQNTDIGRGVIVDDNNYVIVTAYSGGDYATIKYSNEGVGIWTNRYNGPGNGGDAPWAMVLDHNGDFIVAGDSNGGATGFDYTLIKFVSPPIIAGAAMTNGLCQVQMRRPNKVVIEASIDLAGWTPIFTNAATTNLLIYADPNSGSFARRFYQAVRTP